MGSIPSDGLWRPWDRKMPRSTRSRLHAGSAFTLLELLVALSIVAILAGILFPVLARAKLVAKKTATLSNLKQLGIAMNLYLADFDDIYPEAVQGGCFGRAAESNWLWGKSLFPYQKGKQVFGDLTAPEMHAGPFRFLSNAPYPDAGEPANPPPCADANTDRRAAPLGINRTFLSYFQCDPLHSGGEQIGCTNVAWDPLAQGFEDCNGNFTAYSLLKEASRYALFATTTAGCRPGIQGYIASPAPPINQIDGLTGRLGDATVLVFADCHAKSFPAVRDADVERAAGSAAVRFSPLQNRRATLMRASGAPNYANGVLNCVNFNAARVHWNVWAALPGEEPDVDVLCESLP